MATHRGNIEILREMFQPKFDRRIVEYHPNWFPYTRVQCPSSPKVRLWDEGLAAQEWEESTIWDRALPVQNSGTATRSDRSLTCLWADLYNSDIMSTKEETIPLLLWMLVLISSMNNFINVERSMTTCSRINPLLKPLAEKKCKKRQGNLFGSGCLAQAIISSKISK